jgi:thymidylate synthase (FAD)
MIVELLAYTPEPEKIVAAAAKLCYSPSSIDTIMDGLTEEKTASYVEMLSALGHESVIEHASFTFGAQGVSRSLLAQITRHRMASFSVQSQRYVSEKDFDYVIPPEIAAIEDAKKEFIKAMIEDGKHYDKLSAILKETHMKKLMMDGIDEKTAAAKAEKLANEDARFVLPNACTTKMIFTMNSRSLLNFFNIRCCNRAQWEIRELALEMYKLVVAVAPHIFSKSGPSCVAGPCPEGKMSCGKANEMRRLYESIAKGI